MMKEMKSIPHIAITSLAYAPFAGRAELAVQEITARLPAAQFSKKPSARNKMNYIIRCKNFMWT